MFTEAPCILLNRAAELVKDVLQGAQLVDICMLDLMASIKNYGSYHIKTMTIQHANSMFHFLSINPGEALLIEIITNLSSRQGVTSQWSAYSCATPLLP